MSAQTNYNHLAPIGSAGGIADLSPYSIDTFLNEEETGTLKFGVGVFRGEVVGNGIKLPTSKSTAKDFEGISVSSRTTEFDTEGKLSVKKNAAVGVMRYGKVFARVAKELRLLTEIPYISSKAATRQVLSQIPPRER